MCEDWISVERSNSSMEKLLFVTNPEQIQSFNHRFSTRTKDGIIEGHLWMSILYRPIFSNFTRIQRATCALMALMLSMLANAMYFNPEDNYESATSVEVGPLRFSLQQVKRRKIVTFRNLNIDIFKFIAIYVLLYDYERFDL